MQYWLIKSEPTTFSIDTLKNMPDATDHWDGVRNYQARNFMKQMQLDDLAFFYHSNCKQPGIVGIVTIVKTAYPDFTALDPESNYYDPRSSRDKPIWEMVAVKFKVKFSNSITLNELKTMPELQQFRLVQKGNRLSVMPVTADEWHVIKDLV